MGDTRRIRKKYQGPNHPWNKERMETETKFMREYGLRRKKELWKVASVLRNFKEQIKAFPSLSSERAAEQEEKLRGRLLRLGIIQEDTPTGSVLGLDSQAVLDRRLQSIVVKKGLARSMKQARQFITHEHIQVDGKVINAPGYLVKKDEEAAVEFRTKSPMFSATHPERVQEQKVPKTKEEKTNTEEQPEVVKLTKEDEQI